MAFSLATVAEGTLVRMVESGFDALPADRRADACEGKSQGWAMVMKTSGDRVSVGA